MRRRSVAAVALAALVLAACNGGFDGTLPPPPSIALQTTTTEVDFSVRNLAAASGRTTTSTVVFGPGTAQIDGVVLSAEGAIPGAVVHLERLVGNAVVSVDMITNPDGTFTAAAVLGGRYRVRAWRTPDLALVKPEVFFLEATEMKKLEVRVERFGGVRVSSAVAPSPPVVDEPANLVVQIGQRSVDETGVVRAVPLESVRAELLGGGDWVVESSNPTVTDYTGQARWRLRCRRAGEQGLAVAVGSESTFTVEVPPCVDTSGEPPTTGDEPSSTTSTSFTRRTTTTTRPEE